MKYRNIKNSLLSQSIGYIISAVIGVSLLFSNAYAANGDGARVLEEIVVTARKREESLMETPISISAFNGETLADMNLTSIDQIATQTPGLVFHDSANLSGSAKASSVYIRGIGQSDYTLAVEPGVGIYIDDVYLPHSVGNVANVVDVERIEVLRGPQGTLFGRNTVGGAIRVVTKKPHDEFEGDIEFTTGSYDRIDVKGHVNIPLSDTFFVRLSGLSQNRDGFVDRPLMPQDSGDKDSTDLVAQARWLASDSFTADLQVGISYDDSEGAAQVLLNADPTRGQHSRWATNTAPHVDPNRLRGLLLGPELIGFGMGRGCCISYTDTDIPQKFDSYSVDLTLTWDINEMLSIKSISSFRTVDTDFGRDSDNAPFAQEVELLLSFEYDVWSQEIQLSGKAIDERLDWLLGFYYFNEDGVEDDLVQFGTFDLLSGGFFDTEDYAVFAQGTFDVTDKLSLTAGFRYTDEEKTAAWDGVRHQAVIAGFTNPTTPFKNPLNPPFPTVPIGSFKDGLTEWVPYANISYQWNDEFMTYFTYSEGFKGGGVQVRNGPLPVVPTFGPEFVESYEAGLKWAGLEGRMNVSIAGFFMDYTDLQIAATILAGGVANSRVTNAGDAEMTGFEFEAQIQPAENMHLVFGASYLDAEYESLIPGSSVTLDDELPFAPEWQVNASASYDIPTAYGVFSPRIDVGYMDEAFNEYSNSELTKRDSYTMLNLSLGYTDNSGNWSGALFVQNALDEQVVIAGFDGFPAGSGYADGAVSRPIEWGIRVRRSF